jgi:hypothetical protein
LLVLFPEPYVHFETFSYDLFHVTTDGQSWRRAPCGNHDFNLSLWILTITVIFAVGQPLWRGQVCQLTVVVSMSDTHCYMNFKIFTVLQT